MKRGTVRDDSKQSELLLDSLA